MAIDRARTSAGRLAPEAAGAYLGELFEEHARMVYGVCRLMLHERTEAEDAAQQSFLSAYRSLLNGREPREPAPWLATIARNECRARIRARMAEPLALVDESYASPADLESVVSRRAEIAALCEALGELPGPQRDAIVLREFYGLSHHEVSAVVGVSPSAVDALLVRARRRLQSALRPARLASGALVLPLTLQASLAQAVPGFAMGGSASGLLAKLASLPIAAKLAGAATTVAVVTAVGSDGPSRFERPLAGGASSVSVASARIPADSESVGSGETAIAVTSRGKGEGEDGSGPTGRQDERDENEAEGDDPDGVDDDSEGDAADEEDRRDEADDADEPDEPDDDGASNSGPSSSSGSGSDEFDESESDD
jgi:RNA polymerase sigma-70 factor, ECF subfamily